MSNLIVVAGPQAVGKMTVAEKLKEKIGYSLMVNHDSIEVSKKIFDSSNIAWKELNGIIRENVFQIAIKNNVNMIFTFVIAFDMQEDVDYLNRLKNMFEASGGKFYFVELEADLETRLERNLTPHRLGEKLFENQIKINNTNIEPEEVANMIIEKFNLN